MNIKQKSVYKWFQESSADIEDWWRGKDGNWRIQAL